VSERPAEAIERILGETEDADDVLRVRSPRSSRTPRSPGQESAFSTTGFSCSGPRPARRTRPRVRVPNTFRDALVGELWADGSPDRELLEHVAWLVAPQVLIGWDTGGDAWEP